jgi:hypothetical protein
MQGTSVPVILRTVPVDHERPRSLNEITNGSWTNLVHDWLTPLNFHPFDPDIDCEGIE